MKDAPGKVVDAGATPTTNAGQAPAFLGVQALRGVAAVMVVVLHCMQSWQTHTQGGGRGVVWRNGASGVDVFFVISGFVMAVSTIGRESKRNPARKFLGRRIVRLVPMYWILTALTVARFRVAGWPNQPPGPFSVPWAYIAASLFFIPYNAFGSLGQPVLFVGWSLSFEMLFYLLFAVALAWRVGVPRLLTPVPVALVIIGFFRNDHWPTFTLLTRPYLLEFLAGLLLGQWRLLGGRMPIWLAGSLGVCGAVALCTLQPGAHEYLNFVQWAVPAYLVVQAAVMMEPVTQRWWPRSGLLLGDASYSLYLSHPLVVSLLVNLPFRAHLIPSTAGLGAEFVLVAVVTGVSIAIGIVLYKALEHPMTVWLRKHVLQEKRRPID